jgi:hypothetical protein
MPVLRHRKSARREVTDLTASIHPKSEEVPDVERRFVKMM